MSVPSLATALLLYGTPPAILHAATHDHPPDETQIIAIVPTTIDETQIIVIFPPAIDETQLIALQPASPPEANQTEAAPSEALPPIAAGDEIVVTGDTQILRVDPLQEVNLASYEAVQAVDQAFVAPIAKGYKSAIPEPVRDGLGNALRNISEPVNFLNFLLQLKIGKAAETVGRFAVNSTLGMAGLFDVAKKKPFKLPHRRNGFANTLGYYGVKPGPYFYLPLIGPTTLRDMAGNSLDLLLVPTLVGKPFDRTAYTLPSNIIMQLNARIERDAEIQRLQQESPNPYAETRTLYLEMRQNEIDALKNKQKTALPPPISEPAAAAEAIPIIENAPAAAPVTMIEHAPAVKKDAAPVSNPAPLSEAVPATLPYPDLEHASAEILH